MSKVSVFTAQEMQLSGAVLECCVEDPRAAGAPPITTSEGLECLSCHFRGAAQPQLPAGLTHLAGQGVSMEMFSRVFAAQVCIACMCATAAHCEGRQLQGAELKVGIGN